MAFSSFRDSSPADKLRFIAFSLCFVVLFVSVFPSLFGDLVSFSGFGFVSWLLIPMVLGLFFLFRRN